MTIIKIVTVINASVEKCFNVSRDIQIHELSAKGTNEKAIAGKLFGLCELNDEITWQAKHFGIRQQLTVKISKMEPPIFFEDIMLKGAFKTMRHEHHFKKVNDNTEMTDIFMYEVPFGILGSWFDKIILKKYMTRFLMIRNNTIKQISERKGSS
jgi:ligand-binding SRPBCC domain-containing protein